MKRTLLLILLASLLAVPALADPPLRNYNGFATVPSDDPLGALTIPDPTPWAVYMDDFLVYDLAQGTTHYTFTSTTGTVDTNVGISGYPGVLVLTFDAGDNDVGQLQVVSGNIIIPAGKKAIYEIKCMIDAGAGGTIGQEELFFGLSTVQVSTDLTAADGLTMAVDNAIGFWSIDGSANLSPIIRVADVESLDSGATTYADDAWMILSWYYDGNGTTKFYKDNLLISTSTSAIPALVMSPNIFVKAGEAVAKIAYVDYWLVAVER